MLIKTTSPFNHIPVWNVYYPSPGYFLGIFTFQRLISCFIPTPPCASPAPIGGGGACDSSVLPVYLIPGYRTPSQPGRHKWRGEAPGASAFLVSEQEHFFDLNFGILF